MKRRVFSVALVIFLLASAVVVAQAAQKEVIYHGDGGYTVVTVTKEVTEGRAANYSRGEKEYEHFTGDDILQWKAVLDATFTYNGSSATCTKVNGLNVTIYDSSWSVGSKSTSKSGNTAYGYLTMERSILGGTQGVPVTLALTCDRNGNLS